MGVTKPTPASMELAQSILEQEDNPVTGFLALSIGQVMSLNYDGLAAIFDRAEQSSRRAGRATCCGRFRRTLTTSSRGSLTLGE